MSAVIRNGRWRRRDPLQGLSAAMLRTLADLDDAAAAAPAPAPYRSRSLRALAERGLIRRRAGPDGLDSGFALARGGREILSELARRAENRARLIAEKPSRAETFR